MAEPGGADETTELPSDRPSWRSVWGIAAALLIVGLGVAGMIVLGHWALTTDKSPPTVTARAPAPAAPSQGATPGATATTTTTTIASTPDQDRGYIRSLNERGISFANPEAAVYNGKLVCDDVRLGMTIPQIVTSFRQINQALGDNADAYVAISIRAYCPQDAGILPAGS